MRARVVALRVRVVTLRVRVASVRVRVPILRARVAAVGCELRLYARELRLVTCEFRQCRCELCRSACEFQPFVCELPVHARELRSADFSSTGRRSSSVETDYVCAERAGRNARRLERKAHNRNRPHFNSNGARTMVPEAGRGERAGRLGIECAIDRRLLKRERLLPPFV